MNESAAGSANDSIPASSAGVPSADWSLLDEEISAARVKAAAADEAVIQLRNRLAALKRVRDLSPGLHIRVRATGLLEQREGCPTWTLVEPGTNVVEQIVVGRILAGREFPEGAAIESKFSEGSTARVYSPLAIVF